MEMEDILEITGYCVLGYDKDNSVFENYGNIKELDEAISKAKELTVKCRADELRRLNGEPIDWIEVVDARNWEKIYWSSYEEVDKYAR
jgi:hypothetical protein